MTTPNVSPDAVGIPSNARWIEPADSLPVFERPAWQARARCRGMPPAMWFPEQGEPTSPIKAICAGCPVRRECLDYAVTTNQIHGTWGGLSERQRQRMRRGRGAA